uniref:Derlin n=1 Tax=Trypanosoma congolense (strain IL3000) TaxID=1068625 RepID=G0UZT4_TRYCI|nr:conserved hypothetical protein [Trypanosoma congolense IL3000]
MDFGPIWEIPPVTRVLLLLGVLSVVSVSFGLVHPLQMVFSPSLVFQERQYWRLMSTFFYYDRLNLSSIIELNWLYVVSSSIELQYFHRRRWDYCLTLLVGAALLLFLRSVRALESPYLSYQFSKVLVYLFGRLLPHNEVSIFGLFTVQVRFLPVVFLFMSFAFGGVVSMQSEMFANLVGHILWYFLEIFPRITKIHPLRVQHFFVN